MEEVRGKPDKAVLAEHPVTLAQPRQWAYEMHRLRLVPAYDPRELKLPDFEALANKPRPWWGK